MLIKKSFFSLISVAIATMSVSLSSCTKENIEDIENKRIEGLWESGTVSVSISGEVGTISNIDSPDTYKDVTLNVGDVVVRNIRLRKTSSNYNIYDASMRTWTRYGASDFNSGRVPLSARDELLGWEDFTIIVDGVNRNALVIYTDFYTEKYTENNSINPYYLAHESYLLHPRPVTGDVLSRSEAK